jgi:hypothetical protein
MEPTTQGLLNAMNEIMFLAEEAPDGGYTARALGHSIYTQADSADTLHEQVRDAVRCHFEDGEGPQLIRLQGPKRLSVKIQL